jgi:transcriptional regulator with XRE-family HTH domain
MQNARNMIGPQLRRLRVERSLSQPELARLLQIAGWDISRDTIAKIEDQRRWVSDFEVAFVAEALNVPLQQFFDKRSRSAGPKSFIVRLEKRLS